MPITEIKLRIKPNNRKAFRDSLINEFLKELPGKGNGDLTSIYIYYVEDLKDGRRIYLKRPARLNKGMDFEVNVENTNFGSKKRTTMPSHSSMMLDLTNKKKESLIKFKKLMKFVDSIYELKKIDEGALYKLKFQTGHSSELIIKSIKWLFAEQDVTYWNWSGRAMFYEKIKEI